MALIALGPRNLQVIMTKWGSKMVGRHVFVLSTQTPSNEMVFPHTITGAQTDIFMEPGSATCTYIVPNPTPTKGGSLRNSPFDAGICIWVALLYPLVLFLNI